MIYFNYSKGRVTVMTIKNNDELKQAVNKAIKDSGVTKTHIAKQLNISRQQVDNILGKKSFSLDDANRLLNIIGLYVDANAIKKL